MCQGAASAEPADEAQHVLQRWTRLVLRRESGQEWHWRGLQLWLQRRPHLRGLPLPYPSTCTLPAYIAQCREQKSLELDGDFASSALLKDVIYLRDSLGIRLAFIEDPIMSAASGLLKVKKGQKAALRAAAKAEAAALKVKAKAPPLVAAATSVVQFPRDRRSWHR